LLAEPVLRILAQPLAPGRLTDIDHVVIFINENRSFDHYFGRYPGVRGFSDPYALPGVFSQSDPANSKVPPLQKVLPFHLKSHQRGQYADCTHDISHEWAAQHAYWNGGAMDKWAVGHNAADGNQYGFLSMGYYEGSPRRNNSGDIDYFWALADAFTISDSYYCSVIGPTDPNRLYSMSAWLDPSGSQGGPSTKTQVTNRGNYFGTYTWTTYPERLQKAGITWKVYQTSDGLAGDNVLAYFKPYGNPFVPNPTNPLWVNAFGSQGFPADFVADCAAGTLPQVSWVLCSLTQSEHPPAPPGGGENALSTVVNALTSSKLWRKSALFYTYDENGGFFDHVPPPTAPAGTPGEYLTVANPPGGVAGPIGLGFRVPMLVISPFSRGGFVASSLSPSQGPDPASWRRALASRYPTFRHGVALLPAT
jgi:phospholipase C